MEFHLLACEQMQFIFKNELKMPINATLRHLTNWHAACFWTNDTTYTVQSDMSHLSFYLQQKTAIPSIIRLNLMTRYSIWQYNMI